MWKFKALICLLVFVYFGIIDANTDPCLEYQPSTNHCKLCDNGYKLTLVNLTTTLCAYSNMTTCWLNNSFYLGDPSFNSSFTYYSTYSTAHEYCFNCTSFYKLDNGESLCHSGCPQTLSYDFLSLTVDDESLGCNTCALQEYQMNTIVDYSFIGLYVKTCTANVDDVACTWLEFYDPESKRCIPCYQKFEKCSACNFSTCLITAKQYSAGQGLFNYTSRQNDIDQLLFYICPKWQSGSSVGNKCFNSSISNCFQSSKHPDSFEFCWICDPSYKISYPGCAEKDHSISDFSLFVKSGALYNVSGLEGSLESMYFQNSGEIPQQPMYFLAQAFQTVMTRSSLYYKQNVTIYIGRGDHFFFYCSDLSASIFNSPDIVKYCDDFQDYLEYVIVGSDNIYIYFKPLYCSLGTELGYENDSSFLEMCVQDSDPNPTIYVNQAYAYFQIYNFVRFENLHFSGLNQLVRPVKLNDDLSSIPIKFCALSEEPQVGDQQLKLKKTQHTDFSLSYRCVNQNYTGSYIPQQSGESFTCDRNQQQKFFSQQESTLSSSGEPSYHYYFGESYYKAYNIQQARRSNVLFNLIALPEFFSNLHQPPELELVNCTFEYFLQNYESLINVQTNDYRLQEYGPGNRHIKDPIEPYTFLMANAGERGAKIYIYNSEFQHSSFTKGLITYRKQNYIDTKKMGFGNYSYYLMEHFPYVNDEGSYIVLEKSKFYNLNSAFQNISALAIYGGEEVMRDLHLLGGNIQQYQAFLHKGTVLNLEDFGGYVEIKDCQFQFNMHFIPQILNTPILETDKRGMEQFMDSSYTFEYKMAICDDKSHTDKYFFTHGLSRADDIDSLYDAFERLSTIYISRNREMVIIKNNTFQSNIGTFGGAISINSQNWEAGKKPYIIIERNEFQNNMAYLSGNAIYIRNSDKETGEPSMCGGIDINNNNFEKNIGTILSNGGAVSISCHELTEISQQDYFASSNQAITSDLYEKILLRDPYDDSNFSIYKYAISIEDNSFKENFAGSRGSAIYLKQLRSVKVSQNEFIENGPVLSMLELQHSPYVKYLSNRPLSYVNESSLCTNEFDFVSYCHEMHSQISWSAVLGTIYVEHCQDDHCLDNPYQDLVIESSLFYDNQVGYIMDASFGPNTSSQVQIIGGRNNTIQNCTFWNNRGVYQEFVTQKLKDFFPGYYFAYHQASLISISYSLENDRVLEYENVIRNCSFRNNSHSQILGLGSGMHYYGSLIRITSPKFSQNTKSTVLLKIEGSEFTDNMFLGKETQLVYAQNVILWVTKSNFTRNGGMEGDQHANPQSMAQNEGYISYMQEEPFYWQEFGLFYIEGTQTIDPIFYHSLEYNRFSQNFAAKSSVLHVNFGNQFLYLENNYYGYNVAWDGGIFGTTGVISSNLYHLHAVIEKNNANSTILMTNEYFESQVSYQGIFSMILADKEYELNIIVSNSTFLNNYQYDDFSLMSLNNLGKVLIIRCSFQDTLLHFELREAFYSLSLQSKQLAVLTQIFDNDNVDYLSGSNFLSANNTWNSRESVYFGNTEIEMDKNYYEYIEVQDCSFENVHSHKSGVIATLALQSKLLVINQENSGKMIKNCSVYKNGLFHVSYSELVGINLNIQDSYSEYSTALFYVTDQSSASLFNSSFTRNRAQTYGMLYVTGSSKFLCEYCLFEENSVDIDSSILYADNNPNGQIKVNQSKFLLNNSTSNLMTLVSTPTTLAHSQFINNFAQLINNGITTTNSYLLLQDVVVNYTQDSFLHENDFQVDTCFLNVNFQSVLVLEKTTIENCRGGTGGVLQATGYSSVFIKNQSAFRASQSSVLGSGSALYFQTTNEVVISDSHFKDNGIRDIYIQRSKISLINVTFEGGQQQFIYGQAAGINISDSVFRDAKNLEILGKALFCNCYSLTILNSYFGNLTAVKGGALYLSSSQRDSEFWLKQNTFESNQAQFGGAIYVQDVEKLEIEENLFLANRAQVIQEESELSVALFQKGLGGALFLECHNSQTSHFNNCQYILRNQNNFTLNSAQDSGGALMIVSNDIEQFSNLFDNNSAPYGENAASYPSYLQVIFVDNNDYYSPHGEESIFGREEPIIFKNIVSGASFKFVVEIRDQQGNLYSNDDESVATLKNFDSSLNILLQGNEVKAHNGVFNFSSIIAITQPGSELELILEISNLYDFGNPIPFVDNPLNITLLLRPCVSGEQMLNLACEQCIEGYYLYDAPTTNTHCKPCQDNAECQGNNIVWPTKGYWRSDNKSEDWIKCPRSESCLTGDAEHLSSNCIQGYEGIACALCSQNYSRSGSFQCSKCPDKTKNIVKITFILALLILLVVILVFSTMRNSNKQNVGASVYIKIMTSHFQIINALSNVNFNWPHLIDNLYRRLISISQMGEQIFSIDCFIMHSDSEMLKNMGVYFTKLLFYGLLPLIMALAVFIFWLLERLATCRMVGFTNQFISTLVILLFLVHPTITQEMLQAFNCINIGEVYYLRGDLSFQCYSGTHLKFLIAIVIPSVILWCIGIPLTVLLILRSHKNTILKQESVLNEQEKNEVNTMRKKYGFIFNGFRSELYYYEVVIQYRKVMLILITVTFSVVSPEIQSLLCFLILLLSMIYQYNTRPFLTPILNRMELLSLLMSTTTLYSGMYFITGQHYDYYQSPILQWVFFSLLILPNMGFFFYWLYFMIFECLKAVHPMNRQLFCILSLGLCGYDNFKDKYIVNKPVEEKNRLQQLEEDDCQQSFDKEGANLIPRKHATSGVSHGLHTNKEGLSSMKGLKPRINLGENKKGKKIKDRESKKTPNRALKVKNVSNEESKSQHSQEESFSPPDSIYVAPKMKKKRKKSSNEKLKKRNKPN